MDYDDYEDPIPVAPHTWDYVLAGLILALLAALILLPVLFPR